MCENGVPMDVVDLRCQTLINPFGMNDPKPHLSWRIEAKEKNVHQNAYQVIAARSREDLLSGKKPVWDSGKVDSKQSIWVVYGGPPTASRERIWWRVKVWSGAKESNWSAPAFWEASLGPKDWAAKWIGGNLAGGPRSYAPLPYIRRSFEVKGKVAQARLYVTSLGLYEAYLNGKRVGDLELAPGWTNYAKRLRYQTFDVTGQVKTGQNAIGAVLGDGWYCGNLGWRGRQLYGDRPKLLAQLEVTVEDGTTQTVSTDSSWQFAYGPLLEADLLMGESFDAGKNLKGWANANFKPKGWQGAQVFDEKVNLEPEMNHPMRVTQQIKPVKITEIPAWPASRWIFDLGQNIVGRARLKVRGVPGHTVTLRFGEVLDKNGQLYTDNLRSAKQTDHYTIGGKETETWEPKFTFHGFRYVEVSGLVEPPTKETITGVVIHSDLDLTGTFECSDKTISQLQKNIDWGWRGNSLDVPTDCPQRDERLGWTGDAQVFAPTACFNRDAAAFFEKFVQDLEDSQYPNGSIPAVAPDIKVVGPEGGPAWADAFLMVPWTVYEWYGDRRIIDRHFPAFEKFFAFLDSTSKDNLRCYEGYKGFMGFGDWLSIDAPTSHELIGTAFFAHAADLMARMSELRGDTANSAKYRKRFEEIRQSFQNRYITKDGLITSGSQTSYLLALRFGLMPENLRETAIQAIATDISKRKGHLSTGFVGASYLNPELTKAGRVDLAYELLNQKSWPSWLYSVTKGATTIWERWDGWTEEKGFQDPGMNSFNHYAYGAIGMWMYATILGIEAIEPGFQKFRLAAKPGGGLTWAKGHFDTAYGRIESSWKLSKDGAFAWDVLIPPNTTAEVVVPGGKTQTLGSGRYRFESKVN